MNTSLDKEQRAEISLKGTTAKSLKGRILACHNIADHNDFDHPHMVEPKEFDKATLKRDKVDLTIPAHSIVTILVK